MTSSPTPGTPRGPTTATAEAETASVLLVGSDRQYLDELRGGLAVDGVHVEQASGVGEALEALEQAGGRFGCAVLDVSVSSSELLSLYGRLRPQDDEMPITIVFTRSPFAPAAPPGDRGEDVYVPADRSVAAVAERVRTVLDDVNPPPISSPEGRPAPVTPSPSQQIDEPLERPSPRRPALLWVLLLVVGIVIAAAVWLALASG
jgi:ActR/RegA family two-component response regulator